MTIPTPPIFVSKHIPSTDSLTSTTSTSTSTTTSRSPTPPPTLRHRIPQKTSLNMFTSRKYSPLPTSSQSSPQRKRAGGGMPAWKKYTIFGGVVLVILGLGYLKVGPGGSKVYAGEEAWDAENTYTPSLDEEYTGDETDYSPPFRPADGALGPEDEEEEEDKFHALPIDTHRPADHNDELNEDTKAGSPHDPSSDEAKDAEAADEDFTEIPSSNEEETEVVDNGSGVTSFETDPDAALSTFCAEGYPDKPIVQYALTIDAGSTGSRIHVYKFNNCGPSPQLEYETFKAVQPGLSAYARDPTAAAASLDPLLKEAMRVIPEELRKCTPVEVKATAGLRLLGEQESGAILDEVRNRLETDWEFVVGGDKAVEIMDGKDEGVYAWITANYLLGKIGEGTTSTDTLAVMDLGGASTQIVFEPTFPADSKQALAEGEHKYSLKFGGKDFTLYQHSYLGYGLMRARRSVHNLVAFTWSFGQGDVDWDDLSETTQVGNPCLSRGTTRRVELDPPGRKAVNVTMHGARGGFESCNRVVELVMAKDAICEVEPCSFNGVYQPSLLDTFPKGKLLALSYFTDRIKPLLPTSYAKSASQLPISTLTRLAKDVCAGPDTWETIWGDNDNAMAELKDRPEYCLDLTFMNALLGLGYELGPQRGLLVEKKLRGVELGWALGAGLALVENAKLECTA